MSEEDDILVEETNGRNKSWRNEDSVVWEEWVEYELKAELWQTRFDLPLEESWKDIQEALGNTSNLYK